MSTNQERIAAILDRTRLWVATAQHHRLCDLLCSASDDAACTCGLVAIQNDLVAALSTEDSADISSESSSKIAQAEGVVSFPYWPIATAPQDRSIMLYTAGYPWTSGGWCANAWRPWGESWTLRPTHWAELESMAITTPSAQEIPTKAEPARVTGGRHKMAPINWDDIEPGIKEHVKFLRGKGYDTTGSCEHEMYVTLKIHPSCLPQLDWDLKNGGYEDYRVGFSLDSRCRAAEYLATVWYEGKLKEEADGEPYDLVLLKVEPESLPLYFVIRERHLHQFHTLGPEQEYHDEAFYGEHTCPMNWIRDIVTVISDGDSDPHGFASFVRRVPEGEFKDCGDEAYLECFPEVVADDGPKALGEGEK